MTLYEFKRKTLKTSGPTEYYSYFISLVIVALGILILLHSFSDSLKYQTKNSRAVIIFASLFCLFLGGGIIYGIQNRKKILIFTSKLSFENKKKIIAETMKDFNVSFTDDPNNFWSFSYNRKWWSPVSSVYLAFDSDNIFIAVVGGAYGRSGFGQTGKLRKQLNTIMTEKLKRE